MKSVLLALLLAGASLAARAQTYYLDLSFQVLDIPDNTWAVEKVVDGRAGQPPIGIVYRGLGGKSAAVGFRQGVETELTTFLQQALPMRPASSHTIVLCVRSLHIGETMGGNKQQATADLSADVYEHLPTGYHFVRSVGSFASSYGHETTGRHAGHLTQLLSDCLRQLSLANWAEVARQPARALAALPADRPAPLGAGGKRGPAILREAPRRGLYFRLDQFLANQPDTTSTIEIDTIRRHYQSRLAEMQWRQVARVRPLASNAVLHRVVPDGLWGFSDGQQAFVRYEKQFYPLMRQGSQFTFVGEAPMDVVYMAIQSERQARAGAMGGLVGGAIAGATSGGMPDHTAEPMAYGLDLRTGAIGPFPGQHTALRPDTAYVYVYQMPPAQPAGAARAGGVVVIAEGREAGVLSPGKYLEIPWTRFGKPLRMCLTGLPAASPCLLVVPNTGQLNYLRLDAANSRQPWQWVSTAQGAADLDELDRLAKATR
ncbi:hypothetical protein MON38_10475 [Hymenobacter sp. DH14]|uniref:Uncharacterized protein n=1 Tax=Hymenobacter cyanobacteriorum TaxID=2926463 RepID=A0A9X1VFW5_9BACT|nr:hypothetical protein [Hymenobacter cyanobacteriorum]MCI1187845.1 hypothetical protein [Hymenobacter cyanobacteriorum]